MKILTALTILLSTTCALADNGPWAPPCTDCPQFTRPPYPHTGHWHNPHQPGTGINIDVQNGTMVAMYYGYREDGTSVWLLASGELQQSEADDVYWELHSELHEAVGGQLPGDDYQPPDMVVAGNIHIEIMQRNLLRFSIDGTPAERMVPFAFGSHTTPYFEPESDFHLPNFEEGRELEVEGDLPYTPWLIVHMNPDGGSRWGYAYTGPFPHWGGVAQSDDQRLVIYTFRFHDAPPHIVQSSSISCGGGDALADHYGDVMAEYEGNEPFCIAYSVSGSRPQDPQTYFMPIGNFGDRRFTAVSKEGWVMEGYRLSYD